MKKGFLKEFKDFIMRGNVLDMAIGVIVASAFGKITTSLVNDVFMPFIGWIIGDFDLSQLNLVLSPAVVDEAGKVVKDAVTMGIGTFIVTVIDFIIIAFIVFMVVKTINKAQELAEKALKKQEEVPEETKEEVKTPTSEELLTEILEELRKQNSKE